MGGRKKEKRSFIAGQNIPNTLKKSQMSKPTRFYEINFPDGNRKHYRTLKNLCDLEGLNYANVYHQVGRKELIWQGENGCTVQRLLFAD